MNSRLVVGDREFVMQRQMYTIKDELCFEGVYDVALPSKFGNSPSTLEVVSADLESALNEADFLRRAMREALAEAEDAAATGDARAMLQLLANLLREKGVAT